MYALPALCLGLVLLSPALTHAQSALDIPGNGDTLSGIGVISGWKCEAQGDITISLDAGVPIPATYGFPRGDTASVCGDDGHNGFFSFFNWAILGDGAHTAVAYDNGVEFARSTFTVVTTGEEFVVGARARVRVPDFPSPGEITWFAWNQSTQHLEMAAVQTRSVDQSIVKYLTGPVAEGKSPGLIAAIIDEAGIKAIAAAGVRRQGSSEELTINDLVKMGSLTKAMTSTMLATVVADGTFVNGWQTTIAQVFPELRDEIHPEYRAVTLWQLVRHEGGVPDDVPAWWTSHPTLPIIERRYRILRENLADPPGSSIGEYSYSNAGYMVAAAMAEKLTGQSWETLMEERLFAPLGMFSAGFGAPNTPHEVDQPWSHRRDSAGVWIPAQLGYGGPLAPAGDVYCSLEDFAKFVALQFPHTSPAILNRAQLDELLIPIPGNYGGAAGWVVYQGHGSLLWLFAQGGGGRYCGFFAVIRAVPSRGRAYIAAANSHDDGDLYSSETVSMLYSIIDSLIDHSP
ncbi:MAG: serine hydrolase [Desulfurellaceae bacterium]|nr:serine hydrolase [Desulfurellaceae bacterium]